MGVNWEWIAQSLEFSTPCEMLEYWYIQQNKTISQIANIIEVDQKLIVDALLKYNIIEKKSRSGRRPGIFTCRYCHHQFYGDIRNVCCSNEACISIYKQDEKESKHKSANKYNTKQRKKVPGGCIICGRDKGVNRWYCKDCLSAISVGRLFD